MLEDIADKYRQVLIKALRNLSEAKVESYEEYIETSKNIVMFSLIHH